MALALPRHLRERAEAFPAPQDFADAVELYARQFGRHGRMYFVEVLNVWVVELKIGEFWSSGTVAEEPSEIIYLYRPPTREEQYLGVPNIGYTLDELTVQGMLDYLAQTNTLTGRGEYASQYDAAMAQMEKQRVGVEKLVSDAKSEAIYKQMHDRKQKLGVQSEPVGIDFTEPAPESAPKEQVVT